MISLRASKILISCLIVTNLCTLGTMYLNKQSSDMPKISTDGAVDWNDEDLNVDGYVKWNDSSLQTDRIRQYYKFRISNSTCHAISIFDFKDAFVHPDKISPCSIRSFSPSEKSAVFSFEDLIVTVAGSNVSWITSKNGEQGGGSFVGTFKLQ
jgi:hypothetical protein